MRVIERRLQAQLDVEFQPAYLAEIVLARVEKHAVEKRGSGFQRRRIARTQFAVDFDQRFVGVWIVSFSSVRQMIMPTSSRSGKTDIHFRDPGFADRRPNFRGQRLVRFEQHFAGLPVYQVAHGDGAFQIGSSDFRLHHAWPSPIPGTAAR